MRKSRILTSLPVALLLLTPAHTQEVLTGEAAFDTAEANTPDVRRHITSADLPPPSRHQNDAEAPDF